jgi:hypothetical protein
VFKNNQELNDSQRSVIKNAVYSIKGRDNLSQVEEYLKQNNLGSLADQILSPFDAKNGIDEEAKNFDKNDKNILNDLEK